MVITVFGLVLRMAQVELLENQMLFGKSVSLETKGCKGKVVRKALIWKCFACVLCKLEACWLLFRILQIH